MIKALVSDSYEKLNRDLLKVSIELEDKLFWEFEYSSRHLRAHRLSEIDQLLDPLEQILEDLEIYIDPEKDIQTQFLIYVYKLVYFWHRTSIKDGFFDIRFEDSLPASAEIISSLTREGLAIIKKLHELSLDYGFFALELCGEPTDMRQVIIALTENESSSVRMPQPLFIFPKKEDTIAGVEIFTTELKPVTSQDWGIAIYANIEDKLDFINKKIDELWDQEGKNSIGKESTYQIAFFIDQKTCKSKSHTKDVIKLQIENFSQYLSGEMIANLCSPISERLEITKEVKKERRLLASKINIMRATGDLINKSWDRKTGNMRRAIGLLLWDVDSYRNNIERGTKKRLIDTLIDELPDKTFDLYHKLYNKHCDSEQNLQFKDQQKTREVIERELYRDIELAKHCISDRKVHLSAHIRKN